METKSRDVSPPLGAISTWDEVRCRLEVKLPVYAAIPPREGDDSLLQYRSPFRVEKASEVNGHITFDHFGCADNPFRIPFGPPRGYGFAFSNYWLAYAFLLQSRERLLKCKSK